MVRIDVLTMVWSSAPRNIPSSSPVRMVRTCAWVYSPVSTGDGAALVAIGNEPRRGGPRPVRRVWTVSAATRGRFSWTVVAPVVALVVLAASWGRDPAPLVAAGIAV